MTKTQIDRLGDRLRTSDVVEDDLRLLDQYRHAFVGPYESVVRGIRNELGLEPTGRPDKSTTSILDKLRRESIRLSQMQDIAGCRLVVPDILAQDQTVESLSKIFTNTNVVDRRLYPSHGYRAVHVIVSEHDTAIEVQVRTSLQHMWAELSEKLSDVIDMAIKYGAGDEHSVALLAELSHLVAQIELAEKRLSGADTKEAQEKAGFQIEYHDDVVAVKQAVLGHFEVAIALLNSKEK